MTPPMSRRFRGLPLVLLSLLVIPLLSLMGCQRKEIEELVGTELFSLSLGKLENQIDFFQSPGDTVEKKTRIAMRDGWFYIANGNSDKVMVFSSYGDLIFLLYNAQTNPPPVMLEAAAQRGANTAAPAGPNASDSADTVTTRGAVSYPFLDIGDIAVASDKTLYVEDSVPEARVVKDSARGILLTKVILRFDRKGRPEGYLGQEGIGGTPFPHIMALYVTSKDQLVVVTRLPDSWEIFWYAKDGKLLYQVDIDSAHLPVAAENGVIPALVKILPDMKDPDLYLSICLYRQASDDSSRADNTVTERVYKLNLRTRQYESYIELPQNPPRKETVGLKTKEIPAPPSDLIGVSAAGYYYLLGFADTNLYTLQILDSSGRVRARRYVVIEDSELAFRDVHMAPTGLIYGLLVDQTKAHVTWWRSDLLLKGD